MRGLRSEGKPERGELYSQTDWGLRERGSGGTGTTQGEVLGVWDRE